MVEDALRNDEPASQRRLALPSLLLHGLKNMLQAVHVVVIVPPDGAARNLEAFLDGKVDTSVRYDDVTTFAERRNDRADG